MGHRLRPDAVLRHQRRPGFALSGGRYSIFDLSQAGRVVVQTWGTRRHAELDTGREPAEVLAAHTASTGRMGALPAWTRDGAVLGLQGGTAKVRRTVEEMLAAGTKISAVWLQDWSGQRTMSFGDRLWWTWQLDRERYPGWDGLVNDLHRRGIKVLTYVNPFLVDPSGRTLDQRLHRPRLRRPRPRRPADRPRAARDPRRVRPRRRSRGREDPGRAAPGRAHRPVLTRPADDRAGSGRAQRMVPCAWAARQHLRLRLMHLATAAFRRLDMTLM
ncbi:hypothetical protein [Actinomadura sp. 3N407]|uniref:hypothetical protein n=1 Tax=Actinomadura sp. 3N407 TaxID=3457423 RepID=UPI003FCE24F9